jgi:cob(I)alamin adenosyltransferase
MANRLSKIYTRTGDAGTTGLGDGSRVAKNSLRIEAIGAIDELNSALGVLLAEPISQQVREDLLNVQHDLFDLGGELSIPGYTSLSVEHVTRLENELDRYNAELAPLKEFILPGGSRAAALCHVVRAVCRQAERRVISLAAAETLSPTLQQYLNRLSDLLFVLCRVLNREAGVPDVYWQKGKNRRESA